MTVKVDRISKIVLCWIIGILLILILILISPILPLILLATRFYQRRITAGSDNIKQLQGKTVVITGKLLTI